MYLLPDFLCEIDDKRVIKIICKHMNESVIAAFEISLMGSGLDDAKNIKEYNEAYDSLYSYGYFPKKLAISLSNKRKYIYDLMDELKSEEIIVPDDYKAFMVSKGIESLYDDVVPYSLEGYDPENPINENIYRIFDKEDRVYVVNYLRNNLDKFLDYELEGEELLTLLMSFIEDLTTYTDTLCSIVGDGDFLNIEAM